VNTAIGERPKLTAELFAIPVGAEFLIYAPLRRAAFVASAGAVEAIVDIQTAGVDWENGHIRDLLELLRRLEIVDSGPEPVPIRTLANPPKPTTVTLFLTTRCNLRCSYCYASAGDLQPRDMPLAVAARGIDFVLENALESGQNRIEVAYHGGGEPTTNWITLTESVAYARAAAQAHGLQVHAGIATNGVLGDDKIAWIVSHLDGASVSFDGLPEVHDAHRVTAGGGGSSEAVRHTLRQFDERGFAYGLRLTVTAEHLRHLPDSVDYICQHFRPSSMHVEPAYALGRWQGTPSAETAEFVDQFRLAEQIAQTHGRELFFSGARLGVLSNHFCGATQDSFCLTADGSVSACYEAFLEGLPWAGTFLYGRYDADHEQFLFNLPTLDRLRRQSVEHRTFCAGCFAKWSCGGDCYYKNLALYGPGAFTGTDRCHIIRELTKDQILRRIYDAGGLVWHEPDAAMAQILEVPATEFTRTGTC
jgi:uncharacterized protein